MTARHVWIGWLALALAALVISVVLFIDVEDAGERSMSEDHWHAPYQFIACGEKQPPSPTWESGVHTHGDGVIHIHPFSAAEEGTGARLVKWFKYGGGRLTDNSIRMPGFAKEYHDGDACPDGSTGEVQVFVNSEKLDDWSEYIPRDGDLVKLVFGPPDNGEWEGIVPTIAATPIRRLLPAAGSPEGMRAPLAGGSGGCPPESLITSRGGRAVRRLQTESRQRRRSRRCHALPGSTLGSGGEGSKR